VKSGECQVKILHKLVSRAIVQQKGFTLIELLVVVIIIGALAAIGTPSFLNQAAKARGSEAKALLGSINRAQQSYRFESGTFAPDELSLKALLSLDTTNNFYNYTISGTTNTARVSADPTNGSFRVYDAGIAIGSDTKIVQVICESLGVKSSTDNIATAQLTAGASASASCTDGKIVR
jgi:type IV pilus assembly protein PilA